MRWIYHSFLLVPFLFCALALAAGNFHTGDALQVNWRGIWFPAKVITVKGDQLRIHYDGFGDNFDEWVGPDRIKRTVNAASAPSSSATVAVLPATGNGGLDGLYMKVTQRYGYKGSRYMTYDFFWFRPDGHVFFGAPPGGLEAVANFATLEKLDAKDCGVYSVRGGQITLQQNGVAAATYPLKTEEGNRILYFDGPAAIKVARFPGGFKLNADYEAEGTVSGGTVFAFSSSTLHFHSDGTFDGGRFGGFDANGKEVGMWGSAGAGSHGTYSFHGNTLTLSGSGQSLSLTAFPWPDQGESPPHHLGIGAEIYHVAH